MIKVVLLENKQDGIILAMGSDNYDPGAGQIQIPISSFNWPVFERLDQLYYDLAEGIMADRIKLKTAAMILNEYKKKIGKKILEELSNPYVLKNIVATSATLTDVRNELARLKALILAATSEAEVDAAYDSMNYPNGEL